MRVSLSKEGFKWLDTSSIPWKVKEGAPTEIQKELEEALKKMKDYEKKNKQR